MLDTSVVQDEDKEKKKNKYILSYNVLHGKRERAPRCDTGIKKKATPKDTPKKGAKSDINLSQEEAMRLYQEMDEYKALAEDALRKLEVAKRVMQNGADECDDEELNFRMDNLNMRN
jgi:hypothetical protein